MAYLLIAVLAMLLVAGAGLFFGRLFMEGDKDADEFRRLGQEEAAAKATKDAAQAEEKPNKDL